jgi:hypothetical protein
MTPPRVANTISSRGQRWEVPQARGNEPGYTARAERRWQCHLGRGGRAACTVASLATELYRRRSLAVVQVLDEDIRAARRAAWIARSGRQLTVIVATMPSDSCGMQK